MCADEELHALLRSLPSKVDLEAMVGRIEETHRQEVQTVHKEVRTLADWVSAEETAVIAIEQRLAIRL